MAYSSDVATLLTEQLTKFLTLNRHQLAGQVGNLDFWLAEARHCLDVIDGYGGRFQRLKAAQQRHVTDHHVEEFQLDDPCCTRNRPEPPKRAPDADLKDARWALCEAVYRFLLRCLQNGLIEEARLREACGQLDISVDSEDLRSHSR